MQVQERFAYVLKKRFDLSDAQVAALIDKGLTSPKLVNEASDQELLAVPGVGPVTINKIRTAQLAVKGS